MTTAVTAWAVGWLVIAVGLVAVAGRVGRPRAGAWLVVIGVVLLTLEEPALTFWLGLSTPLTDRDGVATLVTPMARAHILDAGVYGVAAAVLLGRIALTAFKRGERWARRVLLWGWVVATLTQIATTVFVFSRGLPLPGRAGVAGAAGFGWTPVTVGLLAWAGGLWLTRPVTTGPPPTRDDETAPATP